MAISAARSFPSISCLPFRKKTSTNAAAAVSFPCRSLPPITSTTFSIATSTSKPLLPPITFRDVAVEAKSRYYNARVVVGDGEDVDVDELVRRFRREVARAGVIQEIKRRRWHENRRDKRKRKARAVAWRYRRRPFRSPFEDEQAKEEVVSDEEKDNWELPEGEFPHY